MSMPCRYQVCVLDFRSGYNVVAYPSVFLLVSRVTVMQDKLMRLREWTIKNQQQQSLVKRASVEKKSSELPVSLLALRIGEVHRLHEEMEDAKQREREQASRAEINSLLRSVHIKHASYRMPTQEQQLLEMIAKANSKTDDDEDGLDLHKIKQDLQGQQKQFQPNEVSTLGVRFCLFLFVAFLVCKIAVVRVSKPLMTFIRLFLFAPCVSIHNNSRMIHPSSKWIIS